MQIKALCKHGKAERIFVQNLPSFVQQIAALFENAGVGTLRVDTAFGGDSFVMVDATALGFQIVPDEAADLAKLGRKITDAANQQLRFSHSTNADWKHFSFCQFVSPLEEDQDALRIKSAVAIKPGKIDRSPTGTAVSAIMAVLHKRDKMRLGQPLSACALSSDQSFPGTS